MNSTQKTARIAGALYLLSAVTAGVPLLSGFWSHDGPTGEQPG